MVIWSEILFIWVSLLGSFLIGAIPTAFILVRILRNKDIRRMGSGNVGTMNVYRQLGTRPALAVLMIDAVKGAVIVWLCGLAQADPYAGLALGVAGHIYPPWLGFRGGKGLATALGGLLVLQQIWTILVFCLAWLPVYYWLVGKDGDKANLAAIVATLLWTILYNPSWGLVVMLILIGDKHRRVIKDRTN